MFDYSILFIFDGKLAAIPDVAEEMKQQKHFHLRALIPALVIGIAVVASCLTASVLARKERVNGARASLPAVSAKREQKGCDCRRLE